MTFPCFGIFYPPPPAFRGVNLYIRGLSPYMNDDDLFDIVAEYGHIISSKAIIDLKTGACKGYGFAMYEKSSEAELAMQSLSDKGYIVTFAVATPRDSDNDFSSRLHALADQNSTNVYISNLPMDMIHDDDLHKLALTPSDIVSCKILLDSRGFSRGVGFVRFYSRESANQMIENFHGKFLPGSSEALQVRFADSEAQKMYKDVLKFYKKSINMFSMNHQGYYSYPLIPNSQQYACSSPDSTLVDEGMEEMLEELSEFDLNK